jgi:hydrogenase maturation protease
MTGEARRSRLVLALGNDLLGDDGVGPAAARLLARRIPCDVEVVEAPHGGLDLLDLLEGRERALLLDAVLTGRHPPGTILEFGRADFALTAAPSPHAAGLPDVLALAERLAIPFPRDLRILAMEVERMHVLGADLTPAVRAALPAYVGRAAEVVASWVARDANAVNPVP